MDLRAFRALAFLAVARAVPSTYDQRQDGRVNVQIDVKDVQILAFVDSDVLDDYVNYDYHYDYADFTIKPKPTTGKPASNGSSSSTISTQETWSAWPTHPSSGSSPSPLNISTTSSPSSFLSNTSDSLSQELVPATILVSLETEHQDMGTTTNSSVPKETRPNDSRRPADVAEPRKRCPAGFHLKSGRCFKRRLSFISPRLTMMKLVPGLLGKSNVLTSNITTENS